MASNGTMVLVAAAMLAACSGQGSAAGQAQAAQQPASRLDVAGVRPGMSAGDVRATLERAGWKVQSSPGQDWAAAVREEAGRQSTNWQPGYTPPKGIADIDASKGDETLHINMQPLPAGPVVKQIHYVAPMAGRTAEDVRATMLKRYGKPDIQSRAGAASLSMTWCTGGERCRGYWGAARPALLVEQDAYDKLNIYETQGDDADRAWQASVKRAVGGGARPQSSF